MTTKISNLKWRWYYLVAKQLVNLVQDLRNEIAGKNGTISSLRVTLNQLESKHKIELAVANNDAKIAIETLNRKRSPEQAWVENAQITAAKQRNRELEIEIAKMGLLRDALKNEKAYTLYLEDCLDCLNPSEVFNALPLEKRKEYFAKV